MVEMVETKEWRSIRIEYTDGDWVTIRKEDLDKIEAIRNVIDALHQAKALTEQLKNILK